MAQFAKASGEADRKKYYEAVKERIEGGSKLAKMLDNHFRPRLSDSVWNSSGLDLFEVYLASSRSGIRNLAEYGTHVVSVSQTKRSYSYLSSNNVI